MEFVTEELGLEPEEAERTFFELAIDSLEFISLIKAVQERYGVEISDDDAQRFERARDIADHLSARTLGQLSS